MFLCYNEYISSPLCFSLEVALFQALYLDAFYYQIEQSLNHLRLNLNHLLNCD